MFPGLTLREIQANDLRRRELLAEVEHVRFVQQHTTSESPNSHVTRLRFGWNGLLGVHLALRTMRARDESAAKPSAL